MIQKVWLLIFSPREKMIMSRFFVVVVAFLMSPQFGEIDIFTILYLVVQEHGIFFHLLEFYLMSFIDFYPGEGDSYPLQYSDLENPTDCIKPMQSFLGFLFGVFVLVCLLWFYCKWHGVFNFELFVAKLSDKQSGCQCRKCVFDPWVGMIAWRMKSQPIPVFLPGKSHDRGACRATVLGITKELDDGSTKQQQQSIQGVSWLLHNTRVSHVAQL